MIEVGETLCIKFQVAHCVLYSSWHTPSKIIFFYSYELRQIFTVLTYIGLSTQR